MSIYQVNEIFKTIQGEGVLAGTPSIFIRLQGCTVGCEWCDTKYTWKRGGKKMTVTEIGDVVSALQCNSVVVTGGEPTLYNLDALFKTLPSYGVNFIQVESSGQNMFKGTVRPSWLTWSPKERLQWNAPLEFKRWVNEVKWVVDEKLTYEMICGTWLHLVHSLGVKVHFTFMPEGCPPRPEMIQRALEFVYAKPGPVNPAQWRYGDRLQWRIGVK